MEEISDGIKGMEWMNDNIGKAHRERERSITFINGGLVFSTI